MRFTQTDEAFYILSLSKPSEVLVVDEYLPILAGDTITMIGAGNGTKVEWEALDKSIAISVPTALADAGDYCWVFKIKYAN